MREEFPISVRRVVAERVGLRCSNPDCRAFTIGPRTAADQIVNVGVAAHITAASPGGPRNDPGLSAEERRSPANGLWLCQNCAKLVDNDPARFPVLILRSWKESAEHNARASLGIALGESPEAWFSVQEIEILRAAAQEGDIWLISADGDRFVRSGAADFHDAKDPACGAVKPAFAAGRMGVLNLCHFCAGG